MLLVKGRGGIERNRGLFRFEIIVVGLFKYEWFWWKWWWKVWIEKSEYIIVKWEKWFLKE